MHTVSVTGQQWVGVSSKSPAQTHISTSGGTNTRTEVFIDIQGFYFTEKSFEGKQFKVIQIPDGQPILEAGCPDLERYSFTVPIPADGHMEVSIASGSYTDFEDFDVLPSAGNTARTLLKNSLQKGQIYSAGSFYPQKDVDSDQPFIVRNTRAQAFHVYPLKYNPLTRVLRFYHHITVVLTHVPGLGVNPLTNIDLNTSPVEGINTGFAGNETSFLKSGTLPPNRGCMLIICPEKFRDAILPLAEWRIQTGIPTEIIGSEQFTNTQFLYNYIKSYYQKHTNLAYLLLVGDANFIPPHQYPHGASDNYYSYLAGNDHYPDILVGRFSAEFVKDVEVQVQRTLQYEQNPGMDASWITNAVGIGSTLTLGDDGESDFQHIRNLLNVIKSNNQIKAYEFFDGSQGGADANGNPSASDIAEKINQGTGIIFYAGHGSSNLLGTGRLTNSVISGLENHEKYPLIWAVACEAGKFPENYCHAEAWLRSTDSKGRPAGGLAVVMASTVQTSSPPMQAQDKIAEILGNPTESLSTMGAVTINGMMSMNDKYGTAGYDITDTWILFGDPALRIRTTIPKSLKVDHKGTIGSGGGTYTIKCNAAEGYACISNKGIILGKAALINGMATIILDQPATGDKLLLTTTALNYLPSVETIRVINNPGTIESTSPVNHSKNKPINTSISWESGDGGTPEYYLIYLGTDNPPTNLINGLRVNSNSFKPQFNLRYDKTYYWKVVSVNRYGKSETKVMDFKTIFTPEEDFESSFKSSIGWSHLGGQKWETDGSQYFDGSRSARSGPAGNNEKSSLIYPCEVTHCDFVSFWCKTSSETGDVLKFSIDGSVLGIWSGETDWSFQSYKIEPGKHELEWQYVKNNGGSAGYDAAWLDDIHLPIHGPVQAEIAGTASACEQSAVEISTSALNFSSVSWRTEGDGMFNDSNLENTAYTPGIIETAAGKTTLQVRINGFEGCPVIDKSVQLTIHPLPVIKLPSDTMITNGSTVLLDATTNGSNTYFWNSSGNSSASIAIDSISSVNGTKMASITITSDKGCSASKDIRVHFSSKSIPEKFIVFPNPSHGDFTLKAPGGSAVIEEMKLVNHAAKVVWKSVGNINIFGSKGFSVTGLPAGEYFLVTRSKNEQSVNPLIIR